MYLAGDAAIGQLRCAEMRYVCIIVPVHLRDPSSFPFVSSVATRSFCTYRATCDSDANLVHLCTVSEYLPLDSRLPALSRSFFKAPRVTWRTSVRYCTTMLGSAKGTWFGATRPFGTPGEATSMTRNLWTKMHRNHGGSDPAGNTSEKRWCIDRVCDGRRERRRLVS